MYRYSRKKRKTQVSRKPVKLPEIIHHCPHSCNGRSHVVRESTDRRLHRTDIRSFQFNPISYSIETAIHFSLFPLRYCHFSTLLSKFESVKYSLNLAVMKIFTWKQWKLLKLTTKEYLANLNQWDLHDFIEWKTTSSMIGPANIHWF